MSKKSYNDIEQIIKQLADAEEPAFDEQAWQKMELLLEKDKDRKKPFFWLWLLIPVLLGAGIYFYSTGGKHSAPGAIALASKTADTLTTPGTPTISKPVGIESSSIESEDRAGNTNASNYRTQPGGSPTSALSIPAPGVIPGVNPENTVLSGFPEQPSDAHTPARKIRGDIKAKKSVKITTSDAEADEEDTSPLPQSLTRDDTSPGQPLASVPDTSILASGKEATAIHKENTNKNGTSPTDSATKKSSPETKGKTQPGFYFIAALGAEMNAVKFLSSGGITPRFGISAGFQFSKKLSVQTGFFASNKKYAAGPQDYKAKAGSYWGMVDIKKIDANCQVYEVPLTARYDFGPGKPVNYFGMAGISSFFMKKEDYHYYYYRFGAAHDAKASYTGNQHLFSVLRFAAGIEKKISPRIAVNASPGFSVPLGGVGEGQVKLYSTDLMIGLKYTPLRKK